MENLVDERHIMCTIVTNEIRTNEKIYAWKVVKLKSVRWQSLVTSPYHYLFRWNPNETMVSTSHQISPYMNSYYDGIDNKVIHCFTRRSDARLLKKRLEEDRSYNGVKYKVIKVELRGRIFKGLTGGMGWGLNELPALCATGVYWDGKFSR